MILPYSIQHPSKIDPVKDGHNVLDDAVTLELNAELSYKEETTSLHGNLSQIGLRDLNPLVLSLQKY